MKQRTANYHGRQAKRYTYPNAATREYHINKLVDYLLTGATTLGIVVAILFLIML